jgi:hypothetical protein
MTRGSSHVAVHHLSSSTHLIHMSAIGPFDSSSLSTVFEYDQRLTNINVQISTMKQERNGLLPLFRLPVEILVRILVHYQWTPDGDPDPGWPYLVEYFHDRWTSVMLVCRRFRSVAVNAPELWRIVDDNDIFNMRGKARVNLRVKRAGDLPLVLLGSEPSLPWLLHRAVMADFRLPGSGYSKEWKQPAPLFHDLSFRNANTFRLGRTLLGGFSSQLERLSLDQVTLIELPDLPALTFFFLEGVIVDDTLQALARSLSHTPNLEVLIVRNLRLHNSIYDLRPWEKINTFWRIKLVKLQVLQINDDPPLVAGVLRIVTSPALALHVTVQIRSQRQMRPSDYDLNLNHDEIFNRCMDIWRAYGRKDFHIPGTLSYYCKKQRTNAGQIWVGKGYLQIGNPFMLDQFGNVKNVVSEDGISTNSGPLLFCSTIDCVIIEGHKCLDHVTTLHLTSSGWDGVPWNDPDVALGLQFLPATLNRVVIENHFDEDVLGGLEDILKTRNLPTGLFQDPLHGPVAIHTTKCGEGVRDRTDTWLDMPDLMITEVTHTVADSDDDVDEYRSSDGYYGLT